jgi:GNAT superfamily N-acetyltransferase
MPAREAKEVVALGPIGAEELKFQPLTPALWDDLEALFGKHGACGGCWCMWWRLSGPEYARHRGQDNKDAFKALIDGGEEPGILAYHNGTPVGWCAIGPRESYGRLQEGRVRIFKAVDDQSVWNVTCFYIARAWRNRGLMGHLLQAAVDFAASRGATVVEGYPVDPAGSANPPADTAAYCGLLPTFQKAGFVEILRRHERRPIVRKRV